MQLSVERCRVSNQQFSINLNGHNYNLDLPFQNDFVTARRVTSSSIRISLTSGIDILFDPSVLVEIGIPKAFAEQVSY